MSASPHHPEHDQCLYGREQEVAKEMLSIWKEDRKRNGVTEDNLPSTYEQLVAVVEKAFGHKYFVYDLCTGQRDGKPCRFIYRCQHRDDDHCPKCNQPRYQDAADGSAKRPRAVMHYHPVRSFVELLLRDGALSK